jgi:hypothetical protein
LLQTTDISGSIGIKSVNGDNLFAGNIIRGFQKSISVERGTHQIFDNHFYNFPSTVHVHQYSIFMDPFGAYQVGNVLISGNYCDNPSVASVYMGDCDNIFAVMITGNLFVASTTDVPAIKLGSGTLIDTVIRDNQVNKFGTTGAVASVDVGAATLGNGVEIIHNTFTNTLDFATEEHYCTFESGVTTPIVLDSLPHVAGAAFDAVGIRIQHRNDASSVIRTGDIAWALQDATAGSEDVDVRIDAMVDGTLSEVARFRGTPGGSQGFRIGNGASGGSWDTYHLMMGGYHLWVDSTGDLRIKSSAPAGDTDGTVVGSQS